MDVVGVLGSVVASEPRVLTPRSTEARRDGKLQPVQVTGLLAPSATYAYSFRILIGLTAHQMI